MKAENSGPIADQSPDDLTPGRVRQAAPFIVNTPRNMLRSLVPLYPVYVLNWLKYKMRYGGCMISGKSFLVNARLGKGVKILGGGLFANCDIGDHTYFSGSETYRNMTYFVDANIGKYCSVAVNLSIFSVAHNLDHITQYPFDVIETSSSYRRTKNFRTVTTSTVDIGNDVWVGANATIVAARDLKIGDGAIIGAGSVITKDVEPYSIVAGNPAKVIRLRYDQQTIDQLLQIKWWDWPEERIERSIDLLLSNDVAGFINANLSGKT
jgi:acetyltransferase-like isoleucine patch superfamily enzyme